MKVWKKTAHNILHRMVLNLYILYSKHSSDCPLKSDLVHAKFYRRFVQEHMLDREVEREPRGRDYVRMRLIKMPPGKQSVMSVKIDKGSGDRTER